MKFKFLSWITEGLMVKKLTQSHITESSVGHAFNVDQDAGIIRGVKILGLNSSNGRRYLREALAKAISMYEGVSVYSDHIKIENRRQPRACEDKYAWLENVKQDADGGLSGDLHYLKSDPKGPKLAESALRRPSLFGLSHDIEGKTYLDNGTLVVEEITKVNSVDVVTDPATTRSLFESEQPLITKTVRQIFEAAYPDKLELMQEMDADMMDMPVDMPMEGEGEPDVNAQLSAAFSAAVMAVVSDTSLDVSAKIAKIKAILKAQDSLTATDAPATEAKLTQEPEEMKLEEVKELLEATVKPLSEQLAALTEAVNKVPAKGAKPLSEGKNLDAPPEKTEYPSDSASVLKQLTTSRR
jgi:hypothetical protein